MFEFGSAMWLERYYYDSEGTLVGQLWGNEPIVIYVTGESRESRSQMTGEDLESRLLLVHLGTSTVELQGPFRARTIALDQSGNELVRTEVPLRHLTVGQRVDAGAAGHWYPSRMSSSSSD